MNANVILHVNNWAIMGGIESLVIDFARTFYQYQHTLLTIQPGGEDPTFISHVRDCGIRYMNAEGQITRAMIEEIDPAIILLHNTSGEYLEGEWPFAWLREGGRRVIGVHHAVTKPLISADLDWFVSDYVRRGYGACEARMISFTMPPCVWERPYVGIERPGRLPVVGRIQSQTNDGKGKVPPAFFDILERIQGCNFFVVSSPAVVAAHKDRDRFTFAPIIPGKMADYLREVDIFAIWGETPETWSRVVTEANLSGIPVVARNHNDGLAEQLRASGGGVLVKTETGFIENIQYLVDHPDRAREMGAAGREWCLENASSGVLRERFIDTFLGWSLTHNVLPI